MTKYTKNILVHCKKKKKKSNLQSRLNKDLAGVVYYNVLY